MKKKISPLFYFAMLLCAIGAQLLGSYLVALTGQRTSAEFILAMSQHGNGFYAMVPVAFYFLTIIVWGAFIFLTLAAFTVGEWSKRPLSSAAISLCSFFLLFCASLASLVICMATQNGFDLGSIFATDSTSGTNRLSPLEDTGLQLSLNDALGLIAVLSNLLLVLLLLNTAFNFTAAHPKLNHKKVLQICLGGAIGIASIACYIFVQNAFFDLLKNVFQISHRKLYDIGSAILILCIVMCINLLLNKYKYTAVKPNE